MTENNSYYIFKNDQEEGPYTLEEALDMDIDVDTMVLSPLADDWQRASDLPEFFHYFETHGVYFPTEDNLASFWQRLLAYLIDCVALYILLNIIIVLLAQFVPVEQIKAFFERYDPKIPANQLVLNLIGFGLSVIYNAIFEATPMRGSIGKKLCRLAVVDADGKRLSFGRALMRNIFKFVSGAALCIGYLAILWNEHRQGWHDQWAKTYVLIRNR